MTGEGFFCLLLFLQRILSYTPFMRNIHRLILLLVLPSLFLVVAGFAATTVTYKPWGVHDSEREKYESILREQDRLEAMAKSLPADAARVATFSTSHDFGRVPPHSTQRHSFVLRNSGGGALRLSVAETTCKCTVGELGQDILLPGQSTEVTLTWNTGRMAEHYRQTATIATNDPLTPELELSVEGSVQAELVVPAGLILSKVNPGVRVQGEFVVYSQTEPDIILNSATSTLGGFDWRVEPSDPASPELLSEGAVSAIKVVFSGMPTSKRGKYEASMSLEFDRGDGGDPDEHPINVSGTVRAPVSFISPIVDSVVGLEMGSMDGDQEHRFTMIVRPRHNENRDLPLKVLQVEPSVLQTELEPVEGSEDYRLTVIMPAGVRPLQFNRRDKRGFVEVGLAGEGGYSNWLPLQGIVF